MKAPGTFGEKLRGLRKEDVQTKPCKSHSTKDNPLTDTH